jgi:3-isopropylmalate/(R)-2-methylmalate dehydratase small subunit
MHARGRCWKFGDNIPTDLIVRSDLALATMSEMVKHVLENLRPEFPRQVKKGDILVAGKHFGQSSGRAIAAKVLRAAGVDCVVVEYAARTFYRNCFEIGLPLLEAPGISEGVEDGDTLSVDVATGMIVDETTGRELRAKPTPPFLMKMLLSGGLIPMAEELAGDVKS